jgi:hypothetical protein
MAAWEVFVLNLPLIPDQMLAHVLTALAIFATRNIAPVQDSNPQRRPHYTPTFYFLFYN